MRWLPWLLSIAFVALPSAGHAVDAPADLEKLYARIATDLVAGEALRVSVYVALCDNDSQGIVPVKNRAICKGDAPARNIYWGTSGGLQGFARNAGYAVVERQDYAQGDVLQRITWRKRFAPGARLRGYGVRAPFDVELTGIAYRGERIGVAMHDFVSAVHADTLDAAGRAPHLVGYIGHDWLLDIDDTRSLAARARGPSTLEKGVFALSCFGDQYIRPLVTRDNARILALNKNLTYPGAWTVGGMIEALAQGADAQALVKLAALRFATAMKKSPGAIARSLSYGP